MAFGKVTDFEVAGELFLCSVDTKLASIVEEALDLGTRHPVILEEMERDLGNYAKAKKRLRLKDKAWQANRTGLLPCLEIDPTDESNKNVLKLETGRPRMSAEVVLMFLVIRGYLGSVTDQKAADQIADSITVRSFLSRMGQNVPASRTILDNINAISNTTRELILDKQLCMISTEGLDTFDLALIDSTSVDGNSAWPTDSELLYKILKRVFLLGGCLEVFGVAAFRAWCLPRWLRQLDQLAFLINATVGKSGGKRKRRKLYKKVYRIVEKSLSRLKKERELASDTVKSVELPPSRKARLQQIWARIDEGISDAERVLDCSRRRIEHNEKVPSTEKVLSVSDVSVAMIVKGGRVPVLGYKPQIVRTENGFVSGLIIEEGNISDSASLLPAISQHERRTGVTPSRVSADDGYASKDGREGLLKMGIEKVSFSGAKGKKVMPDEDWESDEFAELRCKRSAVESIMFTLKYVFEFDRMRRRGIEAVRAEMLEKILAHNFWRMGFVRRQHRQSAA